MSRIEEWLDERLDIKSIRAALLDRAMPRDLAKPIGWLYTLGSATLFLFILQAITGMFLAMNYAPSPDHAYDSIQFINNEVFFGWLLRGIHKWGASAMVVMVVLHMLRVFFLAAYRYPRELTWVVGVFLLLGVMGFGFTGYLLPWDQKAYWATVVGTNIAGTAPFVGDFLSTVLRGGQDLGAVTLTRFFATHVLLLPAVIIVLIGLHLFMVLRQGISAPPVKKAEETSPSQLPRRR